MARNDSQGAKREFSGNGNAQIIFWEVIIVMYITAKSITLKTKKSGYFSVLSSISAKTHIEWAKKAIMTVMDLDTLNTYSKKTYESVTLLGEKDPIGHLWRVLRHQLIILKMFK